MCEVPDPVPLPKTGRIVGIDMGINALITTSAGEQVHNPHGYRQAQAALRRKQRKDFFDKLVYRLVQTYDGIVIEDLKIKNMLKNRPLSKSILDADWGTFQPWRVTVPVIRS
jgi:putative transposase